jgi:hypothetical protein
MILADLGGSLQWCPPTSGSDPTCVALHAPDRAIATANPTERGVTDHSSAPRRTYSPTTIALGALNTQTRPCNRPQIFFVGRHTVSDTNLVFMCAWQRREVRLEVRLESCGLETAGSHNGHLSARSCGRRIIIDSNPKPVRPPG